MAIRCQHFDDDGKPITKRGCPKDSECTFVHPNNPAWPHASRSNFKSNRTSGPSHSRKDSWGGPPKSASKEWDTSLWDSGSGTSKKADDSSTMRKWGPTTTPSPAMKDTTAESPKRRSSNNWTTKSAEENSGADSAWGTTDTTGGWGVDTSVGWGGSGGGGGGWGDSGTSLGSGGGGGGNGGRGDSGTSLGSGGGGGGNGGWGDSGASLGSGSGRVGDNTSTIPSGNDHKGKGKESEDVEMRDSSPSRIVGSFKRINLPRKPESATPLPPVPATPPSTVASKPIRPRPLPLPSRQKKTQVFEDTSLKKLALQIMKKPDKEAEQVQEKPTSVSTQTVNGPKGRADLFSQVIRHTSTVVLMQVELQRAQRDHARWKRTQESAQYERASPATRIILDHHRAELNLRVQEAKRRLDKALTVLVELPDFASRNRKPPGPILTHQTIVAYTAELKDWFSDIELHKRILIEKVAAEAELPPEPVPGDSVSLQLMERDKWSWNDIKNAINELDTRVLTSAEHLYSDVYTTIADLKDQAVVGLQDPCPTRLHTPGDDQCDVLSSTATLVGDCLSAQAIRTAELISRVHELEQEHEHLENETRAMDKLCDEVEVHFSQFEQWRQDDKAKIDEMAEQLRTLYLRRKTPKSPMTPTAVTLQPAQLDGILLRMQPILIGHLQQEVQSIFDALRSRCLENHEGMKGLIEELVTPVLVMTEDICHRVSAMSF